MKTVELIKNKIGNARCAVLGFGVSNIPLVELLAECGNEITIHDKCDFERLDARAKGLAERGVKFVCGEDYLTRIDADIIFRSPGIRPDYEGILDAINSGAELSSEMELFLELTPARIFAITGSDGKTTTTTISYKLLEKEFENTDTNIYVGGNIGTPLLSKVGEMTERDICVLELSSFQLFTMKRSPERAVITNLSPNHLDWHKDMDEYIGAKTNIYKHGCTHLTTNFDNEICIKLLEDCPCEITLFSSKSSAEDMRAKIPDLRSAFTVEYGLIWELMNYKHHGKERLCNNSVLSTEKILLPGTHNIENYMAAISLTNGLVSNETVRYVATTFKGVEHRLEFVRELDGVKYYNSSIDSSPSRTAAALSALTEKPIVICGGYDKNIPFEPLAKALKEKAKAVILTGATAEKINDVILKEEANIKVYIEKDFEKAVVLSREIAKKDDIVLLSPACASFDAFKNFMERGNRFKKIVNDFK